MEANEHIIRRTIDGRELTFVRRTHNGRELSEAELRGLGFTNDTITKVVSEVAGRIVAGDDGSFNEGFTT